jgi:hypothetical protein
MKVLQRYDDLSGVKSHCVLIESLQWLGEQPALKIA